MSVTVASMTINESPAAATLGVSGHADPEGVSPRALTLVVRAEKGADLHAADVYEAAARAVVMLLAHPACAPGGEWEPAVSAWLAGRIRKICKRARGAAWDKAAALPGVTATSGSATVRAFVPCPTDVTPPELAKLQVRGLETSDRPLPTSPPVLPAPELIILVNPVLAMSAGKTAAQVAHASNVAWLEADEDLRRDWALRGFQLSVVTTDADGWSDACRQANISIHDAGFTEIPAGSNTCIAVWA